MNDVIEFFQKYWPAILAASPYITRAYHAVVSGGGIRGVVSAIWFGTNTPKQ